MCMVAPNPCLFNKSCALKGVNLAKFIDDRLAFVFGESRPKFCHEAGLLLLRFVTKRSSTFLFFCFLGFFTDFFLGCLGLVFLLNFLINLFPSHRIRRSKAVLLLWIFYVFVLSCVCYVLCASVYMCFVVTCWERADL